jgi:hypothetical protein
VWATPSNRFVRTWRLLRSLDAGVPNFRIFGVDSGGELHLHALADRNGNASSEGSGNPGGGVWIINGIATS